MKSRLLQLIAFAIAAAIWWPLAHRFWRPAIPATQSETDALAAPLANQLESLWEVAEASSDLADKENIASMRVMNPEWDFMGRTFFILGEANLALREPSRQSHCLQVIDRLMADTLAMEAQHGFTHYLMSYHRAKPWIESPPRSMFIDGEIALCLGARRLVADDNEDIKRAFQQRVTHLVDRFKKGPMRCGESYPDECWLFCNVIGMVALRMSEKLDGEDYGELRAQWLEQLKTRLTDPDTGLLISAWTYNGQPHPAGPGPEGSSIWLAAHMLQVIDAEFAQEQYEAARKHLGRRLFGFGFSREWPVGDAAIAHTDVDSGLTVPVLGASPSASGLALLAAAAFNDEPFYHSLRASLDYGAFPRIKNDEASYLMAGAIGDPVIFYAVTEGPLWKCLQGEEQ